MDKSLRARTRIVMELGKRGIPSVPVFGRYSYNRAMPRLQVHRHLGAIEICYLVRGRQTYEVAGQKFNLRGGDLFLTFPDENHGTGGAPEEKGLLYWLNLRAPDDTGGHLLGLSCQDSKALWSALKKIKPRHFPGNPELKSHMDEITDLAHRPTSPLVRIAINYHLTGVLLAVLASHMTATTPERSERFTSVFAWIDSHLESPDMLTVDRLAHVAKLSPSRFQALFKKETGIPPAEYALRARIAEASRRLESTNDSVTSVAYTLGFSSSQYFASTFRRFTALSPSDVLGKKSRNASRRAF